MNTNLPIPAPGSRSVRIFAVGDTGLRVIDLLIADGLSPLSCVAVNASGAALDASLAAHKIVSDNKLLRGLGSGGDPERARQAAEEMAEELKALCQGVDAVFIVGGLGGGSGTGISPVLARIGKAAGALVLAFVTSPFECEGSRRQFLAQQGLEELKADTEGVICLPNQKVFKLIQENTTVVDTFKITNRLLADCVQGIWRLFSFKGLMEIRIEDVRRLFQERNCESGFAVAEASGDDRSGRVLAKLFAHPMLDDGDVLPQSDVILVSLTGGPNLTMSEVNRVMVQIKTKCESAEVMMGACIDDQFSDRLAVTLITAKQLDREFVVRAKGDGLDTQLLDRTATAKPNSRLLPPAPMLAPEAVQKLLSRQGNGRGIARRSSSKMRQTQLPLEIVSKGRFDRSEPTIHKGEDLDVPTYIRRGVPLN